MPAKLPITVIMLTLNEEYHLPGAIENVKDWAEEIFIVDSLSMDRTVDIALQYGVKIVQRSFTNFGDQWNFALEKLPINTAWTFKLDPDESLSPELKNEIRALIKGAPRHMGYEMDRRLWFMGKPLHVLAPVLRLWRTGKCRFSDVIVNEHPLVDGSVGKLKGIMEHYDSSDLEHWMEKQNRYTTSEAIITYRKLPLAASPRLFGNVLERRMWLKQHFWKLPFRYTLLFLYQWIWLGAWRAGWVGYAWARMRTYVLRLIEYKRREMVLTGHEPVRHVYGAGQPDPRVPQYD